MHTRHYANMWWCLFTSLFGINQLFLKDWLKKQETNLLLYQYWFCTSISKLFFVSLNAFLKTKLFSNAWRIVLLFIQIRYLLSFPFCVPWALNYAKTKRYSMEIYFLWGIDKLCKWNHFLFTLLQCYLLSYQTGLCICVVFWLLLSALTCFQLIIFIGIQQSLAM